MAKDYMINNNSHFVERQREGLKEERLKVKKNSGGANVNKKIEWEKPP